MTRQFVVALVLWAGVFGAGFYGGQAGGLVRASEAGAPENILTMQKAVRRALVDNVGIRAMASNLAAGKEEVAMARSHLFPKVVAEERFMRTTNPTYGFMAKLNQQRFTMMDFAIESLNHPDAVNDYQTSLSLEQPLFMPEIKIGLAMAKTAHGVKTRNFERLQEEVAFEVCRNYLMALTAAEYVQVAEKGVEDAREHGRIATLSYENGLGLYSDTLRAATALLAAEQQLTSARKNHQVAHKALGLLLNSTVVSELILEDLDLSVRELEYYQAASGSRSDVKAMGLRRQNAENNLKMTRAAFLPTLGGGASYQVNDHLKPFGSEGESWQVMGFLKWELFDGNRRLHEQAKARHQVNEAAAYLEGLKKKAAFQVQVAYLEVAESRRNRALAEQALKSGEEGRRLVKVRYENSLSPLVDLLDVQVSLDQARAHLVAMDTAYLTAVLKLGYESGTILQDLGIELGEEGK